MIGKHLCIKELKRLLTNCLHKEENKKYFPEIADYDISAPDERGCSPLFVALSQGYAAQERKLVSFLLENNAVIKNGTVLPPQQIPKLLTQYANANNIYHIFQMCRNKFSSFPGKEIFIEVGAGNGYLKYLLSLLNNRMAQEITERIVETEISEAVVLHNELHGKYMIQKGINDLTSHFGKALTPLVISMNVADTLSEEALTGAMDCMHGILKERGIFLHIMTSSVHPFVFRDISDSYPGHSFFPFYNNGYIGLRAVPRDKALPPEIGTPTEDAEILSALFAQSPDSFVIEAEKVTALLKSVKEQTKIILLKDFSIAKIRQAFERAGFEFVQQEELTSVRKVRRNKYHEEFPGVNMFNNVLGALITETLYKEPLLPDEVVERSTCIFVMGQKRT